MKKLIFSFAFLILCSLMPSFYCQASFQPPVNPQTQIVPDFLQTVAQQTLADKTGLYSDSPSSYDTANMIVNGRTIADSMNEVYIDNANILSVNFYDEEGNIVPSQNTFTAFGYSDIGDYTYVADKTTGEILYMEGYGQYSGQYVSTLQSGNLNYRYPATVKNALAEKLAGAIVPGYYYLDNIGDFFQEASDRESLKAFIESDFTQPEIQYLESSDYFCYMQSNWGGWSVFVPDAGSANCLVSDVNGDYEFNGNSNQAPNIFSSNPGFVTFYGGDGESYDYMVDWGASYYGVDFDYRCRWYNSFNVMNEGGILRMHVPTYEEFTAHEALTDRYIQLMPIQVTNEGDTNNNYYNYTTSYDNEYNHTTNNYYNYELPTSPENYPVNNTLTQNFTYPSTNNYLTNIYNYYTTPQEGESIGQVDDENLTDNIPILSNLRYRFPFSIPFDIYELISGLSVQREAPSFHWELYLPVVDYTWIIDFDLSAWNTQAQIFRTCFLILFIIALGMWAYNHFFGS